MNRRCFARWFAALGVASVATRPGGSRATTVEGTLPRDDGFGEMPVARGNPAHTGEQPGPGPDGTPTVLWRFTTSAPIASSPSVSGGRVFVGSDEGFLFAVNVIDGTAAWGAGIGDRIRGTSAIHDGYVFVANGTLNVVDVNSGQLIARIQSEFGQITSSPVPAEDASLGPTVFAAGVRGASGFIEARPPFDHRTSWRHEIVNHMTTSPTVAGDAVYAGTLSGELFALDAATGTPRWWFATAGGIYAAPAVGRGVVFATSWAPAPGQQGRVVPNASGVLYAVDAESGLLLWQATTGSPVESGPAIAEDTVVVGGELSVFAFDAASGAPRWRFETGSYVRSSPAIVDGVVYIGSADGHLYALDLGTGEPHWRVPVGAPLDTTPAVVDGIVYATCGHALVAIGRL